MDKLTEAVEKFDIPYTRYFDKTTQIQLYLETINKQKDFIVSNIELMNKLKDTEEISAEDSAKISINEEYVSGLSKITNSTVLYNAAIISIYGSYELYLNEIFKGYIDFFQCYYEEFKQIPNALRQKELEKASDFLMNPGRYQRYEITQESVINDLNCCINLNLISNLTEELLISHSGNMNSKQLEKLFNEFGISSALDMIYKNKSFRNFIDLNKPEKGIIIPNELQDEISEQAGPFSMLNEIVEARNSVGHGWVAQNRVSYEVMLSEYVPYLQTMCLAIKEVLVSSIIKIYVEDMHLNKFDKILGLWCSNFVIGINNKNASLMVGKKLYYCDVFNMFYYVTNICNLENNRKSRKKIIKSNIDITIELDKKVKDTYMFFYE